MSARLRIVVVAAAVALLASSCLDEVAAHQGITFGMHIQGGTALERSLVLEHADATTNHGLSWSVMQPTPDTWDFGPADATYRWAEDHGLDQEGSSFAWDQVLLDDLAPWVLDINDADQLRAVLTERARRIFDRYPGLDRINVINEPLELLGGTLYQNHFYRVLGPDYVAQLFALVDAEAPSTTELIINENLVEYSAAKAQGLIDLVDDLVARDVPIDGVGLQSHLLLGEPDWDLYAGVMEDLDARGVAVHITELDVPVEPDLADRLDVQRRRYRGAVETCLAVAACTSITVWGVEDGHSWIDDFVGPGRDPLLFDAEGEPKPAAHGVLEALLAGRPA